MGYFLLAILPLIVFKLWWDIRAKNKGRVINHTLSATIDMVLYFTIAYLLTGDLMRSGYLLLVGLLLRWNVFDIAWNLLNKMKWNYLGNYSILDKIGKKIGNTIYFILKAIILITIILWQITN